MRPRSVLLGACVIVLAGVLLAPPASAYPPEPPGETVTRQHMAALTVAPDGPMTGYDRDKFPHWNAQNGACDTRDVVLQRDGVDVTVDADCEPTGGQWYSVYDGQWVYDDSDVHIDHVVALAEAWRTGAAGWSEGQREAFANDLDTQQLIAVSAGSNLSKSDEEPEEWRPDNVGYRCMYARSWVNVKYVYDLSVTTTEKQALDQMLDRC